MCVTPIATTARTTSTATEPSLRLASRLCDAGNANATNAKLTNSHEKAQEAQKKSFVPFVLFRGYVRQQIAWNYTLKQWLVFDRPLIYSRVHGSPMKFI